VKVLILAVGKPGALLGPAIREYEVRAGRHFSLEVIEGRGGKGDRGQAAEAERLLGRIPDGFEIVALTRGGTRMSSKGLARYLSALALHRRPGVAFLVGGPYGLAESALSKADYRLSLSAMSFPRDLARLLLAEQVYRAGTLIAGQPYHKGS
jgi:23S rRNA (pseudouridine1915-N3)-methyltransferase